MNSIIIMEYAYGGNYAYFKDQVSRIQDFHNHVHDELQFFSRKPRILVRANNAKSSLGKAFNSP
jgi:hypothetical protein